MSKDKIWLNLLPFFFIGKAFKDGRKKIPFVSQAVLQQKTEN